MLYNRGLQSVGRHPKGAPGHKFISTMKKENDYVYKKV